MATEKIDIDVNLEIQKATKAVKTFSDKTEKQLKSVQKNVSFVNKAFASFAGNVAASGAVAAFNQLGQAASKFFNVFVTQGIEAAQVQEDSINKLNIALASSGKLLPGVSEEFQAYASSLQQTTRFGDEVILQNAALIQSLGGLEKDALKRSTQAALDLSSALGIDLTAAATLVGKAAAGEVSSFSRYGLIIRKGADATQTLNRALDAIEEKFGGAAQRDVLTYSGSVQQLSNSFGDLQEEFGFAITRSAAFVDLNRLLSSAFNDLGKFVKDNRGEVRAFALGFAADLVSLGSTVTQVAQGILRAFDLVKLSLPTLSIVAQEVILKVADSLNSFLDKINFKGIFDDLIAENRKFNDEFRRELGLQQDILDEEFTAINKRDAVFRKANESILGLEKQIRESAKNTADVRIEQQNRVNAEAALTAEQQAEKALADEALAQEGFKKKADEAIKQQEILGQIELTSQADRLQAEIAFLDKQTELYAGQTGKLASIENRRNVVLKKLDAENKKEQLQNQQSFFSTAKTLASAESKELQAIGKAAAITDLAIKTPKAVGDSFAFGASIGGPALGFILAGIAATAMAAQAAKVAGVPLATGLTEVPSGFPNDTFQARLTSGERVVNVQQNRDLTDFLDKQNSNEGNEKTNMLLNQVVGLLSQLISTTEQKELSTTVNIGNREIIKEVRAGLRAGRTLAV